MAYVKVPGRALADHIAVVAAGLFYREGIHLVGVDRIAEKAGITKRTLYRYFRSKDDLIAAALRRSTLIRFPNDGTAAERIVGAFEALVRSVRHEAFRGCPFINAAAELSDPRHPGREIVTRVTTRRRTWFAERAAEAGIEEAAALAEQLDVLFDGALANAMKRSTDLPATAALAAARTLLTAAVAASARH